jgi:uncharacterized protein YkwD
MFVSTIFIYFSTFAMVPAFQEPSPQGEIEVEVSVKEQIRESLKVIRSRKLDWYGKEYALEELMQLGAEGQDALMRQMKLEIRKLDTQFQRQRKTFIKEVTAVAAQIAKGRLDKKGSQQLADARKTLLTASRDKNLTKTMVHEICDPAVITIVTLLEVTVAQIFEHEKDLDEEMSGIEEFLDQHMMLFDYWNQARNELLQAEDKLAKRAERAQPPTDPSTYNDDLDHEIARIARDAEIMPNRDRALLEINAALFSKLAPEEAAGIYKLNLLRIRCGIGAIRVDLKLCTAGRGHSTDMVEHSFFAHTSPVPGKSSPSDRANLAGTSGGAENIAAGQETGYGAIQAWWYSPGHHLNMMAPHGRTGIGRHQNHWTQMFGN